MKKKFRCLVCGYVHEGPNPPEECPICHAKADKFVEIKEGGDKPQYASEHVLGVAKGCDPEIWEALKADFMGECSEVGMYLAMSRQAEHAAKFAELIGEVVWDTKTNLKKRYEAEEGACEGKTNVAKKAKQLGYDAIHDTVHEMARDEARHGAGFLGLYKRYFEK